MMSQNQPKDERSALQQVINILHGFDDDTKRKILNTIETFYDLVRKPDGLHGFPPAPERHLHSSPHHSSAEREPRFGTHATPTPKEFLLQKQPSTDVERVACLAYYLTHFRETPHFKTFDISKLNTEAAQSKFSNTAYSVSNASTSGFLVAAGKGNKQLSAAGELYVQALPDKEAARAAMATLARPRRRSKERSTASESK